MLAEWLSIINKIISIETVPIRQGGEDNQNRLFISFGA
jgi:hypothetical protein